MSHKVKKALVCGAGGFIGTHLVMGLQRLGYWVRGVDRKFPEFSTSTADDFQLLDLRYEPNCRAALTLDKADETEFDEVYQLAADMGGMGFIHSQECEIMHNSNLINTHMIHTAASMKVAKYFFASTVCVYRDMLPGEPELTEEQAYPANPDNNYGFEKLYAERMAIAYGKRYSFPVRIARFQNCYGPLGTWQGGREKAPAAMCRKVAEVEDGGVVDVWGDGSAIRSYTYVDDIVSGIITLTHSALEGPINIGCPQYVSVNELLDTVARIAGKSVNKRYIPGPVGVQSRNFSHAKMESTGWRAKVYLEEGIRRTYSWVREQVENARDSKYTGSGVGEVSL